MYCPRCSQQQIPEEVRFCSRCGFQLAGVSQLLKTDGISFIQPHYKLERLPLVKRQELRRGAKLIFLSFFSFVPSLILAGILDHGLPLVIPFITFLVGLAQIFYYFLFGEGVLPIKKQTIEFSDYQYQLNYQSRQSFPFETNQFNTSEFVKPPSITEPTANLYKK